MNAEIKGQRESSNSVVVFERKDNLQKSNESTLSVLHYVELKSKCECLNKNSLNDAKGGSKRKNPTAQINQ